MGVIVGVLKNSTNQPIADTTVSVKPRRGISNADGQYLVIETLVTTNATGEFSIELEPGEYQVKYLISRETFRVTLPDDGIYDISELRIN